MRLKKKENPTLGSASFCTCLCGSVYLGTHKLYSRRDPRLGPRRLNEMNYVENERSGVTYEVRIGASFRTVGNHQIIYPDPPG